MDYTLEEWWASLKVAEKERIASKIAKRPVAYPECTAVWNQISEDRRQMIHDHCIMDHDDEMSPWTEGACFSY